MKEIRNIIDTYKDIDWTTEKVALASVVNVEESSYRRIGARMLVRSNGQWVGGISGGCLEGDALKRSQKAIFKNEPSRVTYDTMEDDQNQIGVGLGCNGRIEVLFTPINPSNIDNEIEILKSIVHEDQPSILIKVIDSPADDTLIGAIKLVHKDQPDFSFAKITDSDIQSSIDLTITGKKSKIFELTNTDQNPVKILVEFIRPETHLIIVGTIMM